MKQAWLFSLTAFFVGLSSAQTLNQLRWFTEDFPPYNYAQGKGGLMVDVLQAVSAALEEPVDPNTIEVYPWSRAVHTAGSIDQSVLFSLARTEQREAQYQWAGPVVPIRIVMIGLPAAAEIPAEQWRIGVVRDDVAVRLVTAAGHRHDQLMYSQYPASIARMLQAQRIDVWAYGELPAQRRLDALPGHEDWQVLEVLSSTEAYFGFHPAVDPQLVERFQSALQALKQADDSGVAPLDKLIERYASAD
ncbi:transporter substrate-binding domain-containing protein [Saccharospirillum sp. HFRX-1]|uniref:substrate-binding periplasmic protein n=1 Tax=unclassified Saccharospirillum TaxID=2633430 RepID=UPI003721F1A8